LIEAGDLGTERSPEDIRVVLANLAVSALEHGRSVLQRDVGRQALAIDPNEAAKAAKV